MAKNLKLNIKNTQIAKAINLGGIKDKLAKKKTSKAAEKEEQVKGNAAAKAPEVPVEEVKDEPAPKIKARSRSAFAEGAQPTHEEVVEHKEVLPAEQTHPLIEEEDHKFSKKEEQEVFEEVEPSFEEAAETVVEEVKPEPIVVEEPKVVHKAPEEKPFVPEEKKTRPAQQPIPSSYRPPQHRVFEAPKERLGPTGKHVKDLLPPPRPPMAKPAHRPSTSHEPHYTPRHKPTPHAKNDLAIPAKVIDESGKISSKFRDGERSKDESDLEARGKTPKAKEFRDVKVTKRPENRSFDSRDKQGLRVSDSDEEGGFRRRRRNKVRHHIEEPAPVRPTTLKVRIPITIKDLASEMKLKASELIAKLFLQGTVVTLNDFLDDETTIQLLGHEFGCEITIDTSEEERIRITDKSIKEEVSESNPNDLVTRAPVVAFMGHVDHGKTSLIDAIRKSDRAAGEAGAITQHIGAFRCHTQVGDIAILDTPGHEAFSAMRARGADVTDIVVLVVAGDEGIRQQTLEAIQHAKAAKVTIVVAINKSDKPNFNPETVYRQLSEIELLPEVWGGQTITVNCSAVTGQGIKELLEMLALQAEVLELKANPLARARGSVLESEMHKGLGSVATVLVQNGTLRLGDPIVFGHLYGRVKTMHNEYGKELKEAGPSTPVEITGLSALPSAGQEFIVVKSEKEAREIAEARSQGIKQTNLQLAKRQTMESLFIQAADTNKKILNVVLRADVQGSLEALKVALQKIESQKIDLNIIFAGVGEVSESDVQLAAASKAVIIGFHTQIESHADMLVKQHGIQVRLHDIIYHAIDDVKVLMGGMLDKLAQENERGKALVKATFKSSHLGTIAGCQVIEGSIARSCQVRVKRGEEVLWKGPISSLKRVKEDVREVAKGLECGIVLSGYSDFKEDDIIEAFDVTYITQEL